MDSCLRRNDVWLVCSPPFVLGSNRPHVLRGRQSDAIYGDTDMHISQPYTETLQIIG